MSERFAVSVRNTHVDGTYQLDGFMLVVRTAYGTRRVPLGLDQPKKLAKSVARSMLNGVNANGRVDPAFACASPTCATRF